MSEFSPDAVFANWTGIKEGFADTICETFGVPINDDYLYRAESFAMTLAEVQEKADKLKYKYQAHGKQIEIGSSDIIAYTTIFSSNTDSSKALMSFSSNAKKASPRETVAHYLQSQRICPWKIPKSKSHINPYLDFWAYSCQLTCFLGPLPDISYADPNNAKMTHPILPVFYHHFGCAVPTYEALYILSQLSAPEGIIDMGSGNGYWTFMLRKLGLNVTAVDSLASAYRTLWISDTVKADGVKYLKQSNGCREKLLLMVYPIVAGTYTKDIIQAYRGDIIVICGTQNNNRYTGFHDRTAEEWFASEMQSWELTCRIALPSFAGKDDAMFIWKKQ